MSTSNELRAEGIELNELERPQRLANIESGLARGHISLSEIFGSSYIFRALKPGTSQEFGIASAPSYKQLFPERRGVPRKIDQEYANYLKRALGSIDNAVVIGDTHSDFQVAENLKFFGVDTQSVIVNPTIGAEHDWGVLHKRLSALENWPSSFGSRTVMLVDVDKTVIGPRTTPMPGEKDRNCDFYIEEARRSAVHTLGLERLLSEEPDEIKQELLKLWMETYIKVKQTEISASWDDEDTNALLTAMVYFGIESIRSLSSRNSETAEGYLERVSWELMHKEYEFDFKGPWKGYQTIIHEIHDNIQAGIATPFESFRMYEYEALRTFYEQGKILTNRPVVEAIQYGLQQGWRVYAVSDKPDASMGMPESKDLKARVTQNLLDMQSTLVG